MASGSSADPFSAFFGVVNTGAHFGDARATNRAGATGPVDPEALPPVAITVLGELAKFPGPVRIDDLRRYVRLNTLRVARVVSLLEAMELAEVRQDDEDDVVELTPRGRDWVRSW